LLEVRYFGPRSFPLENLTVGEFVSRLIWGEAECLQNYCTMGIYDEDRLVAGTVFHNWQPESGVIELTSATTTKRWLTKPVIRAMFKLPFDILGCQLAVLRVSERNEAMVRIARDFGFTEAYVPRLRGRDEGEFIFSFSDDQWRASRFYEVS